MKKKIAYIVDSTMLNTLDELAGTDIFMQPLHVIVNEKVFEDIVQISTNEFYQYFKSGADCSTSQPSPGAFAENYEKIRDKGYTDIIVFTISASLSGTYNSAVQAKELVEDINVHVIDTKVSSSAVIRIVKQVAAFAKEDAEVTIEEIIAYAEQILATVQILIFVGDLDALKKGGRLSGMQAALGKMLQLKPILGLDEAGAIEVVVKERTTKKAIAKVASLTTAKRFTNALLLETSNTSLCEELETNFVSLHPGAAYEVAGLCPVIGVHIGTEATAIVTWTM